MPIRIALLLILVIPTFAFSQTYSSADSANQIILNGGPCSERTFIRVEKLPSLIISKEAFEDTLTSYLKSVDAFYKNKIVKFKFVVTCHSEILNLLSFQGFGSKEEAMRNAILKYSKLWLPGRQNNFIVNSYVTLEFEFNNGKLNIYIYQ